jgi:hypothetical protein
MAATYEHGYAAMARADVDDAKRRRADRSLEPYAAARGLEFHGAGRLAGFAQALPRSLEEQQQLMRGVLPGGRHGVLLHGLLQTHFRDQASQSDLPGSFYSVRTKGPAGSVKKALRPNRTWIPFIGSLLDDGIDDESTPFGTTGAWSPITICATPVPETVAAIRTLRLRSRSRCVLLRTTDVEDVGPLRVTRVDEERPGTVERLLAGPAGALLAGLHGAYWEVRVDFGLLTVQRNGFLVQDGDLDALCELVCALADAFADACAADGPAPPLTDLLPPPAWAQDPSLATEPGMPNAWAPDAIRTAAERGLTLEDPVAWHRRFGGLPTPGRAAIVLHRGDERVLLCTDQPIPDLRAVRPVLVVPSAPGAVSTRPGGVGVPGARVFVQDGATLVWSLESRGYVGDALDHVPKLFAALQATPQSGV